MDVFDSMESQKGLDSSMHAPDTQMHTPESPTTEPLAKAHPTIVATDDDDDDEAFLKELAMITESSAESATVSSRPHNLHFTPPPPEGFPTTYRGQAAEFMINLAQNTVIAWRAMAEPKFLVRFYDYDGKDGTARHQTLVLKLQKSLEIIASHVGTPTTNLKISPPSSLALPDAAPPTTFLVYGASRLLRNTVVDQRIWSVPQVTFEAYPFESNVIPTLILCLAGFICPDEDTIVNSVKSAWLQPLAVIQLAEILLSADPKNFSGETGPLRAQNAIRSMANSARSELLNYRTPGGAPSPRWNVHVTSPTSRIGAWAKIKEYVDELLYPSTLCGTGSTRKFFLCTLCHSCNHPRGLCPFPSIQGWHGPQHNERSSDPTAREYGRGRGGGRGWSGAGRQSERIR